jgi:hypothetical protein
VSFLNCFDDQVDCVVYWFKMVLSAIFPYLLIGSIWGVTNPFLKSTSLPKRSTVTASKGNFIKDTLEFLKDIGTRLPFIFAFLINQSGSLVFYFLLGSGRDMSVVVPAVNSITFCVTSITEGFLEGRKGGSYLPSFQVRNFLFLDLTLRSLILKFRLFAIQM